MKDRYGQLQRIIIPQTKDFREHVQGVVVWRRDVKCTVMSMYKIQIMQNPDDLE